MNPTLRLLFLIGFGVLFVVRLVTLARGLRGYLSLRRMLRHMHDTLPTLAEDDEVMRDELNTLIAMAEANRVSWHSLIQIDVLHTALTLLAFVTIAVNQ